MAKQLKGVLGTKLGMTQVFNDQGKVVPVTVVAAGPLRRDRRAHRRPRTATPPSSSGTGRSTPGG